VIIDFSLFKPVQNIHFFLGSNLGLVRFRSQVERFDGILQILSDGWIGNPKLFFHKLDVSTVGEKDEDEMLELRIQVAEAAAFELSGHLGLTVRAPVFRDQHLVTACGTSAGNLIRHKHLL